MVFFAPMHDGDNIGCGIEQCLLDLAVDVESVDHGNDLAVRDRDTVGAVGATDQGYFESSVSDVEWSLGDPAVGIKVSAGMGNF